MFTGIVETIGTVTAIIADQGNLNVTVQSSISQALRVDQSVSHNGVCLTVTEVNDNQHTVIAIEETLKRSNLDQLTVGSKINLERAMPANGRLDGHIVQGHVDTMARCFEVRETAGSWRFSFSYTADESYIIEKGSICIDGVSLTVAEVSNGKFSVAIIPYTFEHTSFKELKEGDTVNLEFDVIGKYVQKNLQPYLEKLKNLPG